MPKVDRAFPKVLFLVIVALSLVVLWHGLKTWDSYNRRRLKELEHAEALKKLERYEVMFEKLAARGIEPGWSQPTIDGIVEAVNQEDRLVVLSVGKEQKVQPGFHFAVNRGGEYIGKVQVIEVYDDLSGARIIYLKDSNKIQVGDTVVPSF